MGSRKREPPTPKPGGAVGPLRSIDYEAIRVVSRACTLLDVTVERFGGRASQPLAGISANSVKQDMSFRGQHRAMPGELVAAMIEFRFVVTRADGEPLCETDGALWAIYALNEPVATFEPSAVDQFAEVNGLYHAWAFVRELVASSCSRLGLAGVLLPIWTPPKEFPALGEFHHIVFEPVAPAS